MGIAEEYWEGGLNIVVVYWILLGLIGFYIDYMIMEERNPLWIVAAIITGPLYLFLGLPIKYGGQHMIPLMIFATILVFVIWMAVQLT